MQLADRLARFALFDHFAPALLEQLAQCTSLVRFPAGVTVVKEGDSSLDAYVVASGRVRIQRDTTYGTFELAVLHEGELFGETSYVDGGTRSLDAVTLEPTELLLLSPVALATQGGRDTRFEVALWWAFWRSLSGKLRTTNERLTRFFSESGKSLPLDDLPPREVTGSFRLEIDQKQDLFSEQKLSRMEIHFLASLSKERKLKPGEVLFREGDPGDAMYVVVDGRVRIGKQIPGAGEEALAFMERGDWFGEMALIDNQPRSAEATAHDGGAVVLAVPHDVVAGLLDIRKVSSLRLLRILCGLVAKRLREIDDKLVGWFILAGGGGGGG
jgi:CRP/FNR family transcriptional regulator, cyclic AMP receptor protein